MKMNCEVRKLKCLRIYDDSGRVNSKEKGKCCLIVTIDFDETQ